MVRTSFLKIFCACAVSVLSIKSVHADAVYVDLAEELSWTPESATIIYTCDRRDGAILFPVLRKEKEGSVSSLWRVAAMIEVPPSCRNLTARVMYKNRRRVQLSYAKDISRENTPENFATSSVLAEMLAKRKNTLLEKEKEHRDLNDEYDKKKEQADTLGGLREVLAIRERVATLSAHLARLERVQSILVDMINRAKNTKRPLQYEMRMIESSKNLDFIVKSVAKLRTHKRAVRPVFIEAE